MKSRRPAQHFFLSPQSYPRAQVGFLAALLPATTVAVRGISAVAGRWIGSRHSRHILIVGTGRGAVRIRRLFRSMSLARPTVVGHLRGPWESDPAATETGAVLGEIERLGPILEELVVDEVICAAPLEALPTVLPYVRLCEEVGVTSHVQAESMACHLLPEIVDFRGVPRLTYAPARHSPELLSIKRALDVLVAIIGMLATAPIMLICAALIKLTTPGPILFRQRRSGLHGCSF